MIIFYIIGFRPVCDLLKYCTTLVEILLNGSNSFFGISIINISHYKLS